MNKTGLEPYHYSDYRILLNEDFLARSTTNAGYSLRAFSRDLQVSVGFLSEVLRGKKDLGASSAKKIFAKLGFENEELDYIENLIVSKTAASPYDRERASQFVQERHRVQRYQDTPEKDGYLQTVEHFITYGVCRKIFSKSKIQKAVAKLGITASRVNEVLRDLVQAGYLKEQNSEIYVTDLQLTIKYNLKTLETMEALSSLLAQMILQNGGIKIPDQAAQALVLGLDRSGFELAAEAHKHFIQQLNRLAAGSKEVDKIVFTTSFFLAVEPD